VTAFFTLEEAARRYAFSWAVYRCGDAP